MPFDERELLARLIRCEAGGEGDTGMEAVASVVMNRVNDIIGEYGRVSQGSIRNIIYQLEQFACATDVYRGEYNYQNVFNLPPEQIHYDIADWAIAGNRVPGLGNALWFFNPYSLTCPEYFPSQVGTFVARIGDHCFYAPTEEYAQT